VSVQIWGAKAAVVAFRQWRGDGLAGGRDEPDFAREADDLGLEHQILHEHLIRIVANSIRREGRWVKRARLITRDDQRCVFLDLLWGVRTRRSASEEWLEGGGRVGGLTSGLPEPPLRRVFSSRVAPEQVADGGDLEREPGQRWAEAVVQIAAQPPALLLARCDQTLA
jgi:hypothetical protein